MKRGVFIIVLFFVFFTIWNLNSRHYVISPDGKTKLVFEWVHSLRPSQESYIKIFREEDPNCFVSLHPMLDFEANIGWGDSIKIRGGILVEDRTCGRLNWMRDYTQEEAKSVLTDRTTWKHYNWEDIGDGLYE